ncbi:MAG TPA: amino acid adenylation domain-containing protein, partial [Chloroflexota bacterium]|nr:amino acid adenylation domain-containing protein [Chloroflexota bacterium]
GRLEYNTDLFEPTTIERLRGHFLTLLAAVTADPARSLSTLPLLTAAERRQMVGEWNATAACYPADQCVHELFAAQAARTPDAVALVCADHRLSYHELDQRANQLAHYLRGLGVGTETLVAICLERSLEMMVGLLGILKAGGAYVPLDPAYPAERLAFMLSDTHAPVLVTQARLLPVLPAHAARVVCLDTDWPTIARQDTTAVPDGADADHLAYLIYTSGSTGQPKGVLIPHRGLTNYLSWAVHAYDLTAGQSALVHSSLSFDLTITGLFTPLLGGGAVYLTPERQGVDGLVTALRAGPQFGLVKITPAHLEALSRLLTPQELAGCTRAFIIGGENLTADAIEVWRTHAPETMLVNEYGPTETVVGCCVYTVTEATPRTGSIPIGRPIANTHLYVLDAGLQPVPVGVAGELSIGGAGVARGYLNRPDLTAERFLPDPFADPPDARLYRTGDLARRLPDGTLEYLGRLDQQVKLRGYRIELGEIEAVLVRQPGVANAVVLLREDQPGDKRLVAYIVPDAPSVDPDTLRAALRTTLPDYMIPAAFVVLDALPLTPNGKVDRRALPAPTAIESIDEEDFVALRTPVEELLGGMLATLLGLSRVGGNDNFFFLGGHSLLATQMITQIRTMFDVDLPLLQLFENPTVAELARMIGGTARKTPSIGPITPAPRNRRIPLALAQQRLWFLEQLEPGGPAYTALFALRVSGALDIPVLNQA